jgi:hypothetical protein
MRHDDLDRILSTEENIVPSSRFVNSVMDAVRREAATPPPIPFPWKRAITGLAGWAIVLVSFAIALVKAPPVAPSPALVAILDRAKETGAPWIALALVLAFASVKLSTRRAGSHRSRLLKISS